MRKLPELKKGKYKMRQNWYQAILGVSWGFRDGLRYRLMVLLVFIIIIIIII